jgi:hypothetical protein
MYYRKKRMADGRVYLVAVEEHYIRLLTAVEKDLPMKLLKALLPPPVQMIKGGISYE